MQSCGELYTTDIPFVSSGSTLPKLRIDTQVSAIVVNLLGGKITWSHLQNCM